MVSNVNTEHKVSISLYYNIEYIYIIASFITEFGKVYGASDNEQMQLNLLGEEVFSFIMQGIPKYEFDEQFTLNCITDDHGILMEFSSHGKPISNRNLEGFSPSNLDANEENIGLDIINNISDSCEYVNKGNNGWSIVLTKHLNHFTELQNQKEIDDSQIDECSKEKLNVRLATEDDAKGIILLVYNTYRYSYAKKMFYNEEMLREAIRSSKVVSMITVNDKGDIVGHNGILSDSENLWEFGMYMVDPRYRKNMAAFLLIKEGQRIVGDEIWHKRTLYSKCVTSHILSQRTTRIGNFASTALKISIYPRPAFIGFGEKKTYRESLIIGVVRNKYIEDVQNFFVSHNHIEICQEIFTNLGKHHYMLSDESVDRETTKDIQMNHDTRGATLMLKVDEPGKDLLKLLNNTKRTAIQNGVVTIICEVAINVPLVTEFDDIMAKAGYFFSGIDVCPLSKWRVVYTNLLYQDFDFKDIQLYDPFAVKIREYAKQNYEQVEQI